jgi:hypothetical protein
MKVIAMNKIIVVESCRTCPFLGYQTRKKKYVCMALSIDVTPSVKSNIINDNCNLDDAIIETQHFDRPDIVSSEGEAVCKSIPDTESNGNNYLIGMSYHFQRQIDGNIRVFNYGVDTEKFVLYTPKVFDVCFKIESEQSLNIDNNVVCAECGRPKRWCECL